MYGRIVQTIAVLLSFFAIGFMLWTHSQVAYILTTFGAVLFAIGTKIVYFGNLREGFIGKRKN